ncbi:MAG: ATPase [Lachnospiraceae bacterium]|nr:ATPase [Lachnospiraceae bacterium]
MKKYVLIAGVNGVGKSTLCQLIPNLRKLPRINPDEILQEFGNWQNPSDMLAAGKIGIESPELAKERVRARVLKGGHGIPEKYIERRYFDSINNLKKILDKCDLIAFYDNTKSLRRFAIYKNGIPIRLSKKIPSWFEKHILNK